MAKRRSRVVPLQRRRRARLNRRPSVVSAVEQRAFQVEKLEDRMLLAVGPQLVGINPNGEQVLVNGQVLRVAPTDLSFKFDQNQVIDPATLTGVRLTRANHDGNFNNGNEIIVSPGFLGIGDSANVVVMRFAETLPDDSYRIDILGS